MYQSLQFRLSTLFGFTLVCAATLAGWHYFGSPGAFFGLVGPMQIWTGGQVLWQIRSGKRPVTWLDIGSGIFLLGLGFFCLGVLVQTWIVFYCQLGWGWWELVHYETYGP